MFIQGLEVTLWGLLGVFSVLFLFYIVVILFGRMKDKEENEEA